MQGVFKLQQLECKIAFGGLLQQQVITSQRGRLELLITFSKDAVRAGDHVLDVCRRVPFQLHHFFDVKFVVAGAIVRQVGVLDCTQSDRVSHLPPLIFAHLQPGLLQSLGIADCLIRSVDCFVEQCLQADDRATARFERFAVRAEHGPKTDVMQFQVIVANGPGSGEQFGKVFALSVVDHIQNHVGVKVLDTILNCGDIGSRI